MYIADKSMFSFPVKLVEEMNKRKANAIYWVPSAYQIMASLNLFKYVKPEYLKLCLFAGESMPVKLSIIGRNFCPTQNLPIYSVPPKPRIYVRFTE